MELKRDGKQKNGQNNNRVDNDVANQIASLARGFQKLTRGTLGSKMEEKLLARCEGVCRGKSEKAWEEDNWQGGRDGEEISIKESIETSEGRSKRYPTAPSHH